MDKAALAERLNLAPDGDFIILNVQYARWGGEMQFLCTYQPPGGITPLRFRMLLHDCREMQWRVYAHLHPQEDQSLPEAMLVNIHLGRDNHRKPLHILTDFFGLTVLYGTMEIER